MTYTEKNKIDTAKATTQKKVNQKERNKTKELIDMFNQTDSKGDSVDDKALSLENIIAAQLTDRRFAPVNSEDLTKSVTYVTAKNGVFKVVKTPVALFKVKQIEFESSIPGLPEMEEGVELLIPKIPFRKMAEILSWYRDINTKDKTEASVLFFWNDKDVILPNLPGLSAEGKLVTYCPVQKNSAALSDFTQDENVVWLRQNLSLLLETHSHNSMSAFFSGTDDANENMNQFYAVWGTVESEEPQFAFRWVCGDKKVECDPDLLIDWPTLSYYEENKTIVKKKLSIYDADDIISIKTKDEEEKEYEEISSIEKKEMIKGPFKDVDYPEDWDNQHSTSVSRIYSKGYSRGPGHVGYGNSTIGTTYGQSYKNSYSYDYPSEKDFFYDEYEEFNDYGYGEGLYHQYKQGELLDNCLDDDFDVFNYERIPKIKNKKVSSSSELTPKLAPKKSTLKKRRGGI